MPVPVYQTATLQEEEEVGECVALLPDEEVCTREERVTNQMHRQVETAIAESVTLTVEDVGAATVKVSSATLIGEQRQPVAPAQVAPAHARQQKFWCICANKNISMSVCYHSG